MKKPSRIPKRQSAQPLRVAINGFGRVGRAAFKIAFERRNVQIVAINDLTDTHSLAHLLKYDTVYGQYAREVKATKNALVIEGAKVPVLVEKDPAALPWKKLKVDVVLECTGRFVKDGAARAHVQAGAKRVVVSAPTTGGNVATYLIGVNESKYAGDDVVSNASCTTNCVGPVTRVMVEKFGVKRAAMTTVHSYTAEQNLVDGPPPALHRDLRRARAAAQNIVPTTSGAAVSTTEVIPELRGAFDGFALRVPTVCVSISDFTFLIKGKTTAADVNRAFQRAANHPSYQGVLDATDQPLVSSDFIGNPHSAIVDLSLTRVIGGDLVKVVAWYDNEWGYANRLVEMAEMVGRTAR
ncbi:MAG: type I glyceraldehyde-3-phosphate dehydrogenase [Candidatus Kerfeldbacteria bacterium]|nr:type I glyceraldehyde-3-phosphate dehydrogenase [Candidatus Kerfeldbacteria bacterium]